MSLSGYLDIGVMFWAGGDPLETIRDIKSYGVSCGQLGVPGDLDLAGEAAIWAQAAAAEDFTIVTVFCAFPGESYADLPAVQATVGFVPAATRRQRVERTKAVSDFAAALGVDSIACHIGFVPEDREDPNYQGVLEVVREICDHAASHGQTFCLETGQEPADTLFHFLTDVGRANVGVNFDPANMILYGTGDPIQAAVVLSPFIRSVHAKDGEWPVKGVPGALGIEKPLGAGAVNIEAFIAKLKQLGYKGTLHVEREIDDPEQKRADIAAAVALLKRLRSE